MKRSLPLYKILATPLLLMISATILFVWLVQGSGKLQTLIAGHFTGIRAVLQTDNVSGIERGTAIVCQGRKVGSVLAIDFLFPQEDGVRTAFRVTAHLDSAMKGRVVKARCAMPALGLLQQTPVELVLDPAGARLDGSETSVVKLERDGSKSNSMQNLADASGKLLETLQSLTNAISGQGEDDKRGNLAAILQDMRKLTAGLNDPDKSSQSSIGARLSRTLTNLESTSRHMDQLINGLGAKNSAGGAGLAENLSAAAEHHKNFATKLDESKITETLPALLAQMQDTAKELRRLSLMLQDKTERLGETGMGRMLINDQPKDAVEFKPLLPANNGKPKN